MKTVERIIQLRGWPVGVALLLVLVILAGLTAWRTTRRYAEVTGVFDWEKNGHSDFHNGLYLPTRAFSRGDNPYFPDTAAQYGMSRAAPLFSPALFIVNWPLSIPELPAADIIFFALNLVMLVSLGWIGVRMSSGTASWPGLLLLACLLVVSRPGHITLFTGYFTLQMVLGAAIALHFARSRPWLSGAGILLTSFKPNFVLPLLILMAFRRDWRACVWGVVLSGIFALGGLMWLASHSSLGEVIEGFRAGQQALHNDPTEMPENRWTRVDLAGMVARVVRASPGDVTSLAIMVAVLVVPGLAIANMTRNGYQFGATGRTGMIIAIASLLAIHHHSYDCLLLAVPWIGMTFFGERVAGEMSPWGRNLVALLTAVPAANYLATLSFQQRLGLPADGTLWIAITLVNGLCLLLALVVMCWPVRAARN